MAGEQQGGTRSNKDKTNQTGTEDRKGASDIPIHLRSQFHHEGADLY
jgi:hypothetical protein